MPREPPVMRAVRPARDKETEAGLGSVIAVMSTVDAIDLAVGAQGRRRCEWVRIIALGEVLTTLASGGMRWR